jgi:hypothetical protein
MDYGKTIISAAALAIAAIASQPAAAAPARSTADAAMAPTDISSQQRRRIPRITVVPLSHYYRQCDFALGVEHRPSGDVITPRQHCWWALR